MLSKDRVFQQVKLFVGLCRPDLQDQINDWLKVNAIRVNVTVMNVHQDNRGNWYADLLYTIL